VSAKACGLAEAVALAREKASALLNEIQWMSWGHRGDPQDRLKETKAGQLAQRAIRDPRRRAPR